MVVSIPHFLVWGMEHLPWVFSLHCRHNGHDGVSNHHPHDCLLNRLFRRRSKKISKLRVTGFCTGNSPETGEFPAQMASNAENVSIWWRHHHTMDMLWEKFQWILPLYMKPISFQSKASVVCSVTAAVFIDFCLKKLNVFSQHIGQKTNEYLNSTE